MGTTTAPRMTAEQYHAWSTEGDRTQLVGGEVIVNEPKPMHGAIQTEIISAIHVWIREGEGRGLVIPPTSLTLDEENVYGPDVLWFSESHIPPDLREYPEGVSDLCVEIRSPGTWGYDIHTKKAVYEAAGLPELWLVDDVAEVVLVFRRSKPDGASFDIALELDRAAALASPQLPGFSLPLERLFTH
ncbi:MAG: Uma2 family endonuclease [Thermoleophilaceae bacterium]|nr:Uma2 family endonuclease [Thermoleophilaceae bacterium]